MNEKMIDELLKYSMNNKIIDHEFLKRNIKRIINDLELNEYLSKLYFKRTMSNDIFSMPELIKYDRDTHNLVISKNAIGLYSKLYELYDYLFIDCEKPLFHNLIIMKNVLHEIEHINQYKKSDNNDLESDLIRSGYVSLDSEFLESPIERLANLKANKQILDIIKDSSNIVRKFFESELSLDLIHGYSSEMILKKQCPTIEYLTLVDKLDVLEKYNWYSKDKEELYNNLMNEMSLEERLKYGLSISEEELSKVYVKCRKIGVDFIENS